MSARKEFQSLLVERERLTTALRELEESHRSGRISESAYRVVSERYERKLKEVEQRLNEIQAKTPPVKKRKVIPPPRARKSKEEKLVRIGISHGLVCLGLVGGLLIVVSVFLPWVPETVTEGFPLDAGALGLEVARAGLLAPYLTLLGGIIAFIGGLSKLIIKAVGHMLPSGGVIAFAGGLWGLVDISEMAEVHAHTAGGLGIGHGIYVCLAGVVLVLIGTAGLIGGE
jgi:hypothetical protein